MFKVIDTEKPIERMLSALVSDYLSKNYKSLANIFDSEVNPPLLSRESPSLRDILKFYLQRSYQAVSVVYHVKEYERDDSDNPEKRWAVHHAMCYQPIPIRSSPKPDNTVKAQSKNHSKPISKENKITFAKSTPKNTIKKSTSKIVKKDVSRKSKLTSKKSALIKDTIKSGEISTITKKLN